MSTQSNIVTGNVFQDKKAEPEQQAQPAQSAPTTPSAPSSTPKTTAKASSRRSSRKKSGAFKTISEVADELDVQQHVLRFWETKFSHVRPLKRGGGRRYYRPEDVELLKTIHNLLYSEGYTIKGVQKLLRQKGKNQVVSAVVGEETQEQTTTAPAAPQTPPSPETLSDNQRKVLKAMLEDLKEIRGLIGGETN